jgi:hypothetical protein
VSGLQWGGSEGTRNAAQGACSRQTETEPSVFRQRVRLRLSARHHGACDLVNRYEPRCLPRGGGHCPLVRRAVLSARKVVEGDQSFHEKVAARKRRHEVLAPPTRNPVSSFARLSGARRPPVNRTPDRRCHPRAAIAAARVDGSAREPVVEEASTADRGEGRQGDEERDLDPMLQWDHLLPRT